MVSEERLSLPVSAQEGEVAVRFLSVSYLHGLNKDHPTPPPVSVHFSSWFLYGLARNLKNRFLTDLNILSIKNPITLNPKSECSR